MNFFLDMLGKMKKDALYLSVICIALGIILLLFPSLTLNIFCMVFGALIIASGVNSIIKILKSKDASNGSALFFGVIQVIIGINFISVAGAFVNIIASVFGIFIIINGIKQMKDAMENKKYHNRNWLWMMLLAITTTLFGLVITIINPFTLSNILIKIIGICLIYYGISNLLIYRSIKKDLDSLTDDE